jgi:inhibitor of KinA
MVSLEPLGDQGLLARCADESLALRWCAAVRALSAPWIVDVVQAYTTVAVFIDRGLIPLAGAGAALADLDTDPTHAAPPGRLHLIPCCYHKQLDLARVASARGLPEAEVIDLHTSIAYTVYAIGFCPGFPYLGYLPGPLCGVPRLSSPRLRVEAGSVGLTGRQTGIYTEVRPGGWNIIGRTPLQLVDVTEEYFPLRTGDRVRFVPIDEADFARRLGERLPDGELGS